MSTRMLKFGRPAIATSYSPVACSVGFSSGPPMNVAEPRLIWNRLLRNVYSPRSVETTPVSASASASRWTRTGSSVKISMFASRDRTHVLRFTVTSTSTRRFSSSGRARREQLRDRASIDVSTTANSAGSPGVHERLVARLRDVAHALSDVNAPATYAFLNGPVRLSPDVRVQPPAVVVQDLARPSRPGAGRTRARASCRRRAARSSFTGPRAALPRDRVHEDRVARHAHGAPRCCSPSFPSARSSSSRSSRRAPRRSSDACSVPRIANGARRLAAHLRHDVGERGMRSSGRLSPGSSTRIGRSSSRSPVTPENARLIGSVASATTVGCAGLAQSPRRAP